MAADFGNRVEEMLAINVHLTLMPVFTRCRHDVIIAWRFPVSEKVIPRRMNRREDFGFLRVHINHQRQKAR